MQPYLKDSAFNRWRQEHKTAYDAATLLVYLLVVYAWTLSFQPLGRDYEFLAHPETLPWLASGAFRAMMRAFGGGSAGYHLVNLALLYGCMLLLHRFTNQVVQGPLWLGNFAAALFMANPLHSEAILNVSGVADLLPCVTALAALVAYGTLAERPTAPRWIAAVVLFSVACIGFAENTYLVLVLALFESLRGDPMQRRPWRLAPFALLGVAGLAVHWMALVSAGFGPAKAWAPLYFNLYPIGFLPETAQRFHAHPVLGWIAAAAVAACVLMILRKAQRHAIVFALLAMLALRLYPGNRPVDPVHLIGGGQLLLATALFALAVAALFLRMMDHPRWRRTVVASTTTLGLVMFGLQTHSNLAWKRAGDEVRAFQARAVRLAPRLGAPLGVLPDYRYHVTAPLNLAGSIKYDTPFSRALPHVSLLVLDKPNRLPLELKLETWSMTEIAVTMDRAELTKAAPWPYALTHSGAVVETADASVETQATPDGVRVRLRIRPKGNNTVAYTLPVEPAPPSGP